MESELFGEMSAPGAALALYAHEKSTQSLDKKTKRS